MFQGSTHIGEGSKGQQGWSYKSAWKAKPICSSDK